MRYAIISISIDAYTFHVQTACLSSIFVMWMIGANESRNSAHKLCFMQAFFILCLSHFLKAQKTLDRTNKKHFCRDDIGRRTDIFYVAHKNQSKSKHIKLHENGF